MIKSGDTIKGYTVTKIIHTGAFCNSYFVKNLEGSFFMKEYLEPRESNPLFRKFYNNQAIIIDRLNKMGSVTEFVVEHFVHNETYYQIKEKLNGIDLEQWLDVNTEYEDRLFLSIIFCGILKYLHNEEIVHQDLKPAQVMLVDDELGKKTKLGYRLILSDFDWSIPNGNMVQPVGTPFYKSPEHYLGKLPTKESDIFTLGIMIYEFLTGRNPFDHDDDVDDEGIGLKVRSNYIFAQPSELNSDIPGDINNIILQCLQPNPLLRPSIDEIQKTLLGKSEKPIEHKKEEFKPSMISLSSTGGNKMIIYGNKEFGRQEMKLFFSGLKDDKGNEFYKYCDTESTMLVFSKSKTGDFLVCSPNATKNYFMLNNKKLELVPEQITIGDILQLYSTSLSSIIGEFTVESV